jgi:hypothetical protein
VRNLYDKHDLTLTDKFWYLAYRNSTTQWSVHALNGEQKTKQQWIEVAFALKKD